MLLAACTGQVTGPSSATDAGDESGDNSTPSSSSLRRLSVYELRNTIRLLVDEEPQAFEQLPPDSLEFSFDRVVNSQTMSPAHLDGYLAIADELSSSLLQKSKLDDLASTCRDEIMPPARNSSTIIANGTELALSPDYAVYVSHEPNSSRTLYAPDPTATYSGQFEAPGDYELSFSFDASGPVNVEVVLDGLVVNSVQGLSGSQELLSNVHIADAGSHLATLRLQTSPVNNNLDVNYHSVKIVGPIDRGAGLYDDERRSCIEALIDDFAPRAFRRPLDQEQRTRLLALADAQDSAIDALTTLLQAIFASPHFLYLVEVGSEAHGGQGGLALDPWEMSARLSYAICEEPPDEELWQAANNDALKTVAQIETQARRLFGKPCGEATVMRFFEEWLWLNRVPTLNKSPEAFPRYSEDVRAGMLAETRRYLSEMLWHKEADLRTLMSAGYSWPDPRSAFLYGLQGVSEQTETALPLERAGLLTQPSLLAVTSPFDSTSPVKRGVFVLGQLLCDEPPPPPAELNVVPPAPDPNATTRERWAQHSASEACAGCHSLIDPIGFAFEEFDGVGAFRSEENGFEVDAQGGIPSIGIADGSFTGARPLVEALVSSPELYQCVAKQWLRFSLGRVETSGDESIVATLASGLETSSLREALISIVTTEAFTHRVEEQHQP